MYTDTHAASIRVVQLPPGAPILSRRTYFTFCHDQPEIRHQLLFLFWGVHFQRAHQESVAKEGFEGTATIHNPSGGMNQLFLVGICGRNRDCKNNHLHMGGGRGRGAFQVETRKYLRLKQ